MLPVLGIRRGGSSNDDRDHEQGGIFATATITAAAPPHHDSSSSSSLVLFDIMKCTDGVMDYHRSQNLSSFADLVVTTRPNILAISLFGNHNNNNNNNGSTSTNADAEADEWKNACEIMGPYVDNVTCFNLSSYSSGRIGRQRQRQPQQQPPTHHNRYSSSGCENSTSNRGNNNHNNVVITSVITNSLLPKMTKLRHLEISDPLLLGGIKDSSSCCRRVFRHVVPRSNNIESIKLSGASTSSIYKQAHLNQTCCEDIAYAITNGCPELRKFEMHRVSFQTHNNFELILKALQNKVQLEDMQFTGLSCTEQQQLQDSSSTTATPLCFNTSNSMEYTKYIMEQHPIVVEHMNIMESLRQSSHSSGGGGEKRRYSMSQRLNAVLNVRSRDTMTMSNNSNDVTAIAAGSCSLDDNFGGGDISTTTTTSSKKTKQQASSPHHLHHQHLPPLVERLSIISNQLDFCYQLLRNEDDPSSWAK